MDGHNRKREKNNRELRILEGRMDREYIPPVMLLLLHLSVGCHIFILWLLLLNAYTCSRSYVVVVIVVACFSCAAVIFLMPEIEGSSVGMKTGFFDFKQFFLLSRGKTFHALSFFLCEKMLVHRTAVAALVYSSCERIFFLTRMTAIWFMLGVKIREEKILAFVFKKFLGVNRRLVGRMGLKMCGDIIIMLIIWITNTCTHNFLSSSILPHKFLSWSVLEAHANFMLLPTNLLSPSSIENIAVPGADNQLE